MDISKTIKKVLGIKLSIEWQSVKLDSLLIDDLGIDSLVCLEIIVELERNFDIRIDDHVAFDIKTVRDLVNIVSNEMDNKIRDKAA